MAQARGTQEAVQGRLFCNKRRLRASLVLIFAVLLPFHVLLVPYFALLGPADRGKESRYGNFQGPFYCNFLYCLEPEAAAGMQLQIGLALPAVAVLLLANWSLLRSVRREYAGYYERCKAEYEAWTEKHRRHLWELPADRRQRRIGEALNIQAELAAVSARRRPSTLRVGCYSWFARSSLGHRGTRTALDRVLYFVLKDRILSSQEVAMFIATTAFVVTPLFILFPLFLAGQLRLPLNTNSTVASTLPLVFLIILPPLLMVVGYLYLWRHEVQGLCRKQRRRRRAGDGGLSGDEAEDDDDDEDDEEAQVVRYDMETKVGMLCDRLLRQPRTVLRHVRILYLGMVLPLAAILPMWLNGSVKFALPKATRQEEAAFTLYALTFSPLLFAFFCGIASSLRRRGVLRYDAAQGKDDMAALRRLARLNGLPPWLAGEYPHFSVGYVIVTRGIRPRRNPLLHTGFRFAIPRLRFNLYMFFLFPLAVILPMQQHMPRTWLACDRALALEPGTVSTFLASIVYFLVCATLFVYGAFILWSAVPRPVKAAAPSFGAWLATCVALPLALYYGMDAQTLGQAASFHGGLLFAGLLSLLPVVRYLPRCFWATWTWVKSLSLDPRYHDTAARLSVVPATTGALAMPSILALCCVILFQWKLLAFDGLLYVTALVGILASLASALSTVWLFMALIHFDYLRRPYGLDRLRPVCALVATLGVATVGIDIQADYIPGYGGIDIGSAYFRIRTMAILAGLEVLLLGMVAVDVANAVSHRARFGYHPAEWELWNPILSLRPGEIDRPYIKERPDDQWKSEDEEEQPSPDMTLPERCKALRCSLMLESLPYRTLWACAARMERWHMDRGELLAENGEACPFIAVIERGFLTEVTHFTEAERDGLPAGITPDAISTLRHSIALSASQQQTLATRIRLASAPGEGYETRAEAEEGGTGYERVVRVYKPGDTVLDVDYLSDRAVPVSSYVAESATDLLVLRISVLHQCAQDKMLSPDAAGALERAKMVRRGQVRDLAEQGRTDYGLSPMLKELMEENEDLEEGFVYKRPNAAPTSYSSPSESD